MSSNNTTGCPVSFVCSMRMAFVSPSPEMNSKSVRPFSSIHRSLGRSMTRPSASSRSAPWAVATSVDAMSSLTANTGSTVISTASSELVSRASFSYLSTSSWAWSIGSATRAIRSSVASSESKLESSSMQSGHCHAVCPLPSPTVAT
jgi:hypothetical protein